MLGLHSSGVLFLTRWQSAVQLEMCPCTIVGVVQESVSERNAEDLLARGRAELVFQGPRLGQVASLLQAVLMLRTTVRRCNASEYPDALGPRLWNVAVLLE